MLSRRRSFQIGSFLARDVAKRFYQRHGHSVPKHQRPLTYEEKQKLKNMAMQLELDNKVSGITLGREGFSPNVLGSMAKILARDRIVKVVFSLSNDHKSAFCQVTMMLTCKMDQMEVRDKVQDMTDSILVLGMGLKLFFYRLTSRHLLIEKRETRLHDTRDGSLPPLPYTIGPRPYRPPR